MVYNTLYMYGLGTGNKTRWIIAIFSLVYFNRGLTANSLYFFFSKSLIFKECSNVFTAGFFQYIIGVFNHELYKLRGDKNSSKYR